MDAILHFETVGLRHGHGPERLSGIDLMLGRGETVVVRGAPGAGKSALLALAALHSAPSRGVVRLFGEEPARLGRKALAALRRRIGFAGEALPLLAALGVADNVALPLRLGGTPAGDCAEPVAELLAWLRLDGRAAARPEALSAGERRRAEIARATIARPELLLLDDPLAGQSVRDAARIEALVERLRELGTATLWATGEAGPVPSSAIRTAWLAQGRLTHELRPVRASVA